MAEEVRYKGSSLTVVTPGQAELADVVICPLVEMDPGHYTDNVHTVCSNPGCGRGIVHRPTSPARVRKICMPCGLEMMHASTQRGEPVHTLISEKTAQEVREYWRKNGDA